MDELKQPIIFKRINADSQNSEKILEKPNLLQRIWNTLINPVKKEDLENEHRIAGKISYLKEELKNLEKELNDIKEKFNEEGDEEILALLKEVINPMIREAKQINHLVHIQNGRIAAIKHFQDLNHHAKGLVELVSSNENKELIKEEIVKHLVNKSMNQIKRDIEFIQDYYNHFIKEKGLSDTEIGRLREEKNFKILPHIKKLTSLQVLPETLSFESIVKWRHQLDHERAKYFEAALQAIDSSESH